MTARATPRFLFPLALGIVLIVALWARGWELARWPLWLDEAYSGFAAEKGLGFIWTVLPTYETHPPFYSTVLSLWIDLAGTSLLGFRALGLLASLLTLPLLWIAARELARAIGQDARWLGVLVLAIAAVSPALVDVARLVRPYYLIILVNAAGCWALLRMARGLHDDGRLPPRAFWSYVACLVLLVWLHSLGSLYAAALGLALVVAAGPRALLAHWKLWLAGHVVAALLVLPALLILADQAPTWTRSTWLGFSPAMIPRGIQLSWGLQGWLGVAMAAVLVGAALWRMPAGRRRLGVALLTMAVFPVAAAIVISMTVAPVFLVRTLVATSVPLLLLIAAGAGRALVTRALFALIVMSALIWTARVQQAGPEQEWDKAVAWLAPRLAPGDIVYAYPNEASLAFRYALRYAGVKAAIRDIPSGIPARDPAGTYPTGSRGAQSLPDWRLAQIADDPISRRTPVIWLLRLNTRYYDPDDAFLKILEARRDAFARLTLGPIEIVGLRQRPPAPNRKASGG